MTPRERALAIWQAGVDAVQPARLVAEAVHNLSPSSLKVIADAPRLLIVGAGKASAAMAEALEKNLSEYVSKMQGLVNVPEGSTANTQRIRLHPARPQGVNYPTAAGVTGALEMLALMENAGSEDVAICLLSGGGSALLPAPAEGITLEAKLAVTKLLHASGATIQEMNAVRKHLSAIKGGRLAQVFQGKLLLSFVISDVIGDPLDAIASGPTSPDPTTFRECKAILERFGLWSKCPTEVRDHLEAGLAGSIPETLKTPSNVVHNLVIGNNATALAAASAKATDHGYTVLNLGSFIEGETREVATAIAGVVRSIRNDGVPIAPPACLLLGGETTVSLGSNPGQGGRNQEFTLAMLDKLGADGMKEVVVLSGGTDGEDGPTDAAGAIAVVDVIKRMNELNLSPAEHLARHDAYPFFDATGGLMRSGLTGTNVMDVRVVLIENR
jgi:hydroxypyruvate reductase/glycerate 2-kinase